MLLSISFVFATFDLGSADWYVKKVNFVNECSRRVFVIGGTGWVEPGKTKSVKPGGGVNPFPYDRVSVSYDGLTGVGMDQYMNVFEMNEGTIHDSGKSFVLNGNQVNLMGYNGWYDLDMEVTFWNQTGTGPFCTSGISGARTILDFGQCVAQGGSIGKRDAGRVCEKKDHSHFQCGKDQSSALYQLLLHSTENWQPDAKWRSDATGSKPLTSFLCDPASGAPKRGVGFLIGCKPASTTVGTVQVRLCPAPHSGTSKLGRRRRRRSTVHTSFEVLAGTKTNDTDGLSTSTLV